MTITQGNNPRRFARELRTYMGIDMATDEASIEKETKTILRQVQDHLYQVHQNLGAERITLGMVDVLYHSSSTLSSLNYATPRRNAAWVSSNQLRQGLSYLHERHRTPRVQFIEALFPPQFADTLRQSNLTVERETPIMVYKPEGIHGRPARELRVPKLPDGIAVEAVKDQHGVEAWWYVWRNAHYDVLTLGVEPLFVGRDMAAMQVGQQLDFILYRYGFPVGVARMSFLEKTAHLLALALLKEVRSTPMIHLLQTVAVKAALERGAQLVFAPGETDAERRMSREVGFVDFGSIVCYADRENTHEDDHANLLEFPVLAF
jgi:hypothetical protein